MPKLHIWIGTTTQTEQDYNSYFELDYSTEGDFDDPAYKVCGFCQDIGAQWYDEDLIGIVPVREDIEDVHELLLLTPVQKPAAIAAALHVARSLGISKGNAIFYFADTSLVLDHAVGKLFNGLTYIGAFDSILS